MFNPEKEQQRKVAEDINRKRILGTEPDDVFNKPITETFDSKSHPQEDAVSRQELDVRLVEQYANSINILKEKWEAETNQFRKEVLDDEIVKIEAAVEELLSKVSPEEFEENLEKNNPE